MDIIKVAQDLIKFQSETGNISEINKVMDYINNLFAGTSAKVDIYRNVEKAPVIFIRNCDVDDFDVLVLGHIDVVAASQDMFDPKVENGKMYGRGTLDMKSFAAVALNSMEYVLSKKLPIKFGVILSSDEEKGSHGTEAFLNMYPEMKSKIVLDNDVGGDITKLILKCKNPVFVKLVANGEAAHGSRPWDGIDANELMLKTIGNLRKVYPYYSKNGNVPADKWIDTMHVAKIKGGEVANVICNYCEALCDIRLTENSSVEGLEANLNKCMEDGVTYEIVSSSTPVVMDKNDPYILDYKAFAEQILDHELHFEYEGGATDSRAFAVRGSTVIMHSGNGDGMHAEGEYVEIDSVLKIADIQIKFLEKLASNS
ncbi:MAG: M20/M25/M40 family metallo-hydrolase [Alphaproteobacteria bacterium]|nr:M20/M25/M40 family metallo-hydrolase [Alphaproteobacteria bacterium]